MASAAEQMASSLSFANFTQATDLKKRLWFTIGALIVFRMLSYVPLPGIDPTALGLLSQQTNGGVLDLFNNFSGGALKRMSIIALGVTPYITASIVVQLATSLSPTLNSIKKEGESGRNTISSRVQVSIADIDADDIPRVMAQVAYPQPPAKYVAVREVQSLSRASFLVWDCVIREQVF